MSPPHPGQRPRANSTDKSPSPGGCGGGRPCRESGGNECAHVPQRRPHVPRMCEYAAALGPGQQPYNRENTASRRICEVKRFPAWIVVRWVATREVRELQFRFPMLSTFSPPFVFSLGLNRPRVGESSHDPGTPEVGSVARTPRVPLSFFIVMPGVCHSPSPQGDFVIESPGLTK